MIFLWVASYGVLYSVGGWCSNRLDAPYSVTAALLLVYAAAFAAYSAKRGKGCAWRVKFRWIDILYLAPFAALPVYNFVTLKNAFDIHFTLLTVGVCIVEELFFRGYALSYGKEKRGIFGIVVACGLFALLHAVNFPIYGWKFTVAQILSAFCAGLSFSGVTLKYRSLLPATVAHFAINVSSVGVLAIGEGWYYAGLAVCSVLYAIYGLALIKRTT